MAPGNTLVSAVATDPTGNIYVSGHFSGFPDFDMGSGAAVLGGQSADGFVAKYSPDGNLQWVSQIGGQGEQYPTGLAVLLGRDHVWSGSWNRRVGKF
jgi:hypothetical protein